MAFSAARRSGANPDAPAIWHRFGTLRAFSPVFASAVCTAFSKTVDFIEETWSG